MKQSVIKRLLLAVSLALVFSSGAKAQEWSMVEGRVVDSATKEGIPLCNIYLSGTSYGMLTDKTGKFIIKNLPPGEYTMVISHIAYGNMVKTIDLLNGNKDLGTISLKEVVTNLSTGVTVESSEDKKWKSRFRKFSRFMMGENFKAKNIEYRNPWVAEFTEEKRGVLRPENEFSLQIENRYLGYRTNYLVTDFMISNRLQYVVGYPNFEPMESGNAKEQRKWKRNREEAYTGSLRHFFKSLLENTLEENEFIANLTNADPEKLQDHYERVIDKSNYSFALNLSEPRVQKLIKIESTENENIKRITCKSIIEVYHIGSVDEDGESPRSMIKMESDSFLVYTNGVLVNMRSLRLFGFFSQRGLYELLPFEYDLTK
ncbi:MAG: carboxypeptidase-like regulatory domain-containing protein [Roseivirga sp.]|nr:carboxypeptidase-like regulatory domain-containing protein [Roseivirga sp.]